MNPKDFDALIAHELNSLSICDRERTMEEIHGIHARDVTMAEERTDVDDVLRQLQMEIDNIAEKDAYNAAVLMGSRYVFHRTFRLKFVRAEQYDLPRAAVRMINYLDFARELYGPAVLTRPIRWSDLSDNAQSIVVDGSMQVLPERDPAGRRVVHMSGDVGLKCSVREKVRGEWYSTKQDICVGPFRRR
jgi:hypothetical protein